MVVKAKVIPVLKKATRKNILKILTVFCLFALAFRLHGDSISVTLLFSRVIDLGAEFVAEGLVDAVKG